MHCLGLRIGVKSVKYVASGECFMYILCSYRNSAWFVLAVHLLALEYAFMKMDTVKCRAFI